MKVLLFRLKWLQHILFWSFSFAFIGSYFSISSDLKLIDFVYSGFFHVPLIALVYLNLRFLVPGFFTFRLIPLYLLLATLAVIVTVLLHNLLFDLVVPALPLDLYIVSFTELQILVSILVVYLAITTLLKLSKSYFLVAEKEKQNVQLELETLKNQVNPHFLFNTLNTIYSMALTGSADIAPTVLKLSDLLRFMLYETSEQLISLDREIEIISTYLELQKQRLGSEIVISMDIAGNTADREVPPLVMLNLVENAFKHGVADQQGETRIIVSLEVTEKQIAFSVINSYNAPESYTAEETPGGLGLSNSRKRLDLLYGKKARLETSLHNDRFTALLTIKE